jgi:DnaK suppressor protein
VSKTTSKAPTTIPAPTPTGAGAAPAPDKAVSAQAVAPSAAPKPAGKATTKAAGGKAAAAVGVPPPTPSISRFAERFAPPKPPARGYPEPMDIVKTAHKADPKLVNAWKTKAGRDLTEPELLAMPEDEYMGEKQLEFFRTRLQALKDDLLSNAGETTEHLREDTSIVPDPADRATIEEEHALELRTRDRERKLLKKITQSLARIDASDYGFCDETGEPIGLGRLLARPTATLSLEAQQRREMKQKMFGD